MTISVDYIEKLIEANTLCVVHTTSSDNQCNRLIGNIDKVLDDSLIIAKGKYNEILVFFDQIVAIREWTADNKRK